MDVFQCPECELRFRFANELEDHLAADHRSFHAASASVDALVGAAHRHRRTTPRYPSDYRVGGPSEIEGIAMDPRREGDGS